MTVFERATLRDGVGPIEDAKRSDELVDVPHT